MAYLVNSNQQRAKFSRTVLPFTFTEATSSVTISGGYTAGHVDVFKNRQRLQDNEYTASNGTSINFTAELNPGDYLEIVVYTAIQTDNVVKKSGDAIAGTLITQDVIPTSDNTYNLGNTTNRFADLYLSGNTIYLGGVVLSANATDLVVSNTTGGAINLTGNVILGTGTSGDYVANVSAGAGLTGTSSGEGSTPTISVVANNGVIANSSGVFVKPHAGITVSSSGVAVSANDGIISNTSGVFVKAGTGVTVDTDGVSIGQDVATTANVEFNTITTTDSVSANVVTSNTLDVTSTANVGGDLNVTGLTSIVDVNANTANISTLNVTGLTTIVDINANTANVGGDLTVTGNGAFADVTISGNLTVSGTTTYVDTTQLNVGDNIIALNADITSGDAPSENAGIEINRGSSANSSLLWNETSDKWTMSANGNVFVAIASNNDVSTAYANAITHADTMAATAYSNATSYADTKASAAYTNAVSYTDTKAAAAYSNATSYADTKAATAYSNATSYTDTRAAVAYSNAVSDAAIDAASRAATAYSNAVSYANTKAAAAYSNAVTYAAGVAGDAYSNAVSYTDAAVANAIIQAGGSAGDAYTNAVSYADTIAGIAFANAVVYANTKSNQAYSNAVSVAATDATSKADAAYSNAVSYADTKAGAAYSNAVSVAATDATSKADAAYSNATSYADTKAATAYSNATSYADTTAATAYSNATSYADTKAGQAYSNAVSTAATDASSKAATAYSNATSYADTMAATAYSNAVSYADFQANAAYANAIFDAAIDADSKADTAYSNAISVAATDATSKAGAAYTNAASYTDTKAGQAYSNAVSYADTKAATAYSNATSFSSNADNISSGTVDNARLKSANTTQAGIVQLVDSVTNTSITIAATANSVATALAQAVANAATAYTNATSYADTKAGDAYSNAVSYTDTKAATAYSNATSYADTKADAAYTNAVSFATTRAATAYSNAVSYTDGVATTTYNNAAGYADIKAGQAYSNAIAYSANASTITSGTLDTARLPATVSIGNSSINTVVNSTAVALRQADFKPVTPATVGSWQEGRMYYDSEEKTIVVHGAGTGNVELTLGQREWVRCRNNTGTTIAKGKPVYVTGVHIPGDPTHGHHPTIGLADASDAAKTNVIGITGEAIADGQHGYVIVRGYIEGIDTSALTSSETVHLGYATPGDMVTVAPTYPNYPVELGTCLSSNSTVGTMYVNILNQTFDQFRVTAAAYVEGTLTVEGDLILLGNTTTTSVQSLSVANTFIYLSGGDASSNNNFTGSGLNDVDWNGHLQYSNTTTFYVKIVSTGGTDTFAWSKDNFATVEANNISITGDYQWLGGGMLVKFNATTGHTLNDVWSATLTPVNLDTGIIGNYHTGEGGAYYHAGYFRDATDNKFKFFNHYTPEPNTTIDTSHASFQLADLAANSFTGTLVGDITGNSAAAAALITARKIQLSGDVSGNVLFDGTANVQITTTIGTLNTSLVIANTLSVGNTSVNGTFITDGANASFANSTLFVDHENERIGIKTEVPTAPLTVGEGGATLTTPSIQVTDTQNSYIQVALQNLSNGEYASADFVITADNGTDLTNYVDLGLGSSGYNYPDFGVVQPLDGYLYTQGGRTLIGTGTGKDIVFFTGATTAGSEKVYFYSNGVAEFLSDVVVADTVTAGFLHANVDASNIVSGTISNSRLNAATTSAAGIVQLVDSVTNTSVTIAATANSVKQALALAVANAATAYTNATSYADTKAATAYSNATSYTDTVAATAYSNAVSAASTDASSKAATAYSNAVSTAATDASSKAATAYSNAVSTAATDASSKAATAYSNATSYADTISATAYSNAVSTAATDASTKAATAYTNATSYADTKAATAYSNATSYADTKAATAYSNATSYADTKAATAYSNATSYADTIAATAYSNATAFSANASNITSGTVSNLRLNAANTSLAGIVQLTDSVVSTSVTTAATPASVKTAYDTAISANTRAASAQTAAASAYTNAVAYAASNTYVNDTFAPKAGPTFTGTLSAADVSISGNLTVSGTTTYVNTTTLNIGDNIITLNADATGTPSENAGIEVNRGTSANTLVRWNEAIDQWQFTNDGTAYASIASNNDVTTAYSNAVSYADTKAATAYSNATSYADTKAATAYSNATAFSANASNITSGTLNTARLPATANISTQINVGNSYVNTTYMVAGTLKSTNSSGDEGGEIQLAAPANTTLITGVTIDVFQDKLRIFETGGTNRGYYVNLASANAGVADMLGAGGGGGNGYGTVTVSGTDLVATSTNAVLTFINGGGISIVANTADNSVIVSQGAVGKQSFTGNGSNTDFTLSQSATADDLLVFIDGLYYHPGDDYTVATTTLTFAAAPNDGAEIRVRFIGSASSGTPSGAAGTLDLNA